MPRGLRIGLIGPLPPPSGGMANQTEQLARLLEQEGAHVEVVQTNAAYRPAWIGSVRVARALCRLVPYLARLWHAAGRMDLFHVMANSGWAWHLCAAPAVWIAKSRGLPVVVNYHGGSAERFFARSLLPVRFTMRLADRVVVPSAYLQQVFARFRMAAHVIPNVVDSSRYSHGASGAAARRGAPNLVVARNLEPVYDIGTAVRALAIVRRTRPRARLTVAGSGPDRDALEQLAATLGVSADVTFTGTLDADGMAALYREADLFLNPSLVDNMPVSILEAWASGVPVVSTNVGGIPLLVEHGRTGLLVPPRSPEAMARAALELLDEGDKAQRLARAGREAAQRYGWQRVRGTLLELYAGLMRRVPENRAVEAE